MLRFSVILVVVTAGVLADEECMRYFIHGASLRCCKGNLPMPSDEMKQAFKECHNLPHGEKICDRDLCIATKRGYTMADGKMDKAKLKENLEKDMESSPALFKAILERCVDGDLSHFGTPDTCDATKFMRCSELQFIKTCPEWKNEGPCEGLKDINEGCQKKFNI